MQIEEWRWVLSYLAGYIVAQVVGGYIIKNTINVFWNDIRDNYSKIPRPNRWIIQANVLGRIEVTLYYLALILTDFSNATKIIGAWLALKTIPQFAVWKGEPDRKSKPDNQNAREEGKERYNIFLIGSSLQIIYVIVGWKLSGLLFTQEYLKASIAFYATLIISAYLLLYVYINSDRAQRK